jgi:hypothetical protein
VKYWRDIVGLVGLLITCAGVYILAGLGWMLVTLGLPVFAGYAWGELRHVKGRK